MGEEQSLRARITALVARVQSLSGDRLRRDEELARLRPLADRAEQLEARVAYLESKVDALQVDLTDAKQAAEQAEQARLEAEARAAALSADLERALRAAERARTKTKKIEAEARAASAAARLPPVPAPVDNLGVAVMPGETRSANYNLTLRFRYLNTKNEETERSVDLYGVRLETRCYLRAHCKLRGDTRDFRLDRILGEVIVEDTGEIVPPLDLFVRLLEAGE